MMVGGEEVEWMKELGIPDSIYNPEPPKPLLPDDLIEKIGIAVGHGVAASLAGNKRA